MSPRWPVLLFLLLTPSPPASRQGLDVVLCGAPGIKANPIVAPDGRGGAIVAWADARRSGYDLYATHLLPSGRPDPSWPANGRALCEAPDDQAAPTLAADGRGGAVAVWFDQRGGKDHDLYAQRIIASGGVDPGWPKDGLPVCVAPGHQQAPMAVADGAGGAIVAWFDHRGGPDAHIYAQHVRASGSLGERWPTDGLAITTSGAQYFPQAVPDGAGGAIVAWYDRRVGDTYDVYAQHVLGSGTVDPRWPPEGRALCTARNDQRSAHIAPDGHGGAFVAWDDGRDDPMMDVYAQHLLGSGGIDRAWPDDGRPLALGPGSQHHVALAPDGAGGVLAVWEDERSGSRVVAQHLLGSGAIAVGWPKGGAPLCAIDAPQSAPVIEADGQGGAVVVWQDFRNGKDPDLYWARVTARGAPPAYPGEGRALCRAVGNQVDVALTRVSPGVVVAAWVDWRKGGENEVRVSRIVVPAVRGASPSRVGARSSRRGQ